ncbi:MULTISPECIES: S4 domain-containing protein YaaA [Bacillaceae]|uniref:S4 domain-containing protein YaaA n=1 Tax=Bacillaceae TaxID=186817 RepID=UPI0006AE8C7B|nr:MULTISPECIES: S4 domain-containing protein YaaA [Bacillaceae]ALC87138.1 RNA-binding protein [Bacillus sp. FJAT-22090]KQL34752.1 RNA-binding protein [Psychrobacillus sp. FJAT-21963]MDF2067516.1 S4 domain-containing protein YaaA [Bacillus sp. Cr_A10]
MEEIRFDSEFITLGQLLKMTDAIDSGGMAKWFLSENIVYVNGEVDQRRGRKLRNKDIVNIPGVGRFQMVGPENGD